MYSLTYQASAVLRVSPYAYQPGVSLLLAELPPWLYNAILRQREILAVHPDYFRLTGGLERWLYRLARKSVPDKAEVPAIHFRMDTLHERSGCTRPLKKFAFDIRKMAASQPLPEYGLRIDRDGKQ